MADTQQQSRIKPDYKPKKLPYSCEEIYERMDSGLCIFCEEHDTPGHYQLKHKGVRIFMTECDVSDDIEEVHQIQKAADPFVKTMKNSDPLIEPLECASALQVQNSIPDVLLVHKMDSHVKEVEELPQQSTSGNGKIAAHQVFDQIPLRVTSKVKQRKYLKGWKFKFKTSPKRSKLMDNKLSFVEENVLLNEDHKEIIWDCVNKEFKETMTAHGKRRIDLVDEIESRPEVLDQIETFMFHQKPTRLIICDYLRRLSRANHVWKPGGLLCVQDHNGSVLEITQRFHGLRLQGIIYMGMKFQEVIVADVLSVMVLRVHKMKLEAEQRLEIYGWECKKHRNQGQISLNGMGRKLVYDKDKKKRRNVEDDVKKDKKFDHSLIALSLQVWFCVRDMSKWSTNFDGDVVKRKHWLVNYLLSYKNMELYKQREAVCDSENKKLRNVEADDYEMTRSLDLIYGIVLSEIKSQSLFASKDIYLPWSLHKERKRNNEASFDGLKFFRDPHKAMIEENIWLHLKFELMLIYGSLPRPPESNVMFRGVFVLQDKNENVHVVSELTMLVLVSFKSSKGNGVFGLFSETIRVVLVGFLLGDGVKEASLVCSRKRWSFHVVSVSFLAPKNKREFENNFVEMTKVKQNQENCQGGSLLKSLKRHKAGVNMAVVSYDNIRFVNYLRYLVKSYMVSILRIEDAINRAQVVKFTVEQYEKLLVTIFSYVMLHSPRPPDMLCSNDDEESSANTFVDASSSVCKFLFSAFVLNLLAEYNHVWCFFVLLDQWKWYPPEQLYQSMARVQYFILEDKDVLNRGVL